MNCIYKEYEVKNATVPMTTAKNEVVIGLLHENYYLVRGIDLWWGGNNPHTSSLEKPVDTPEV